MSIREKVKDILNKDIYKNVFILFSGFSVAQLIPLLATIALTRIFTKEQFGIFFIYSSLCAVFSMVISLKLELAIVLPSKNEDGRTLFFTSLLTTLILSVFVFLIIAFFFDPISSILGEKNIGILLYFLPLSLLFLGITQSCSYWFNRNSNFKSISITRIAKSSSSSVLQISLGLLSFLRYGLVFGLISGQFVSAIYSLYISFKNIVIKKKDISANKISQLIKKYKSVPIFNSSIAVSNAISNHMPIFLLTAFYSIEMTALYGLANRIIATPLSLVGQSVEQVLYNEASKRYNNGENLRNLVISTYKKLAKLAIIPFIILLFTAPFLFSFIFGIEWKLAGTFSQIMVPWLFLGFLNYPLSYIITVLNKQSDLLIYNIILLIFRFIALYAGYKYFDSIIYSISLYALVGVVFNIFLLIYIIRISNTQIKTETLL
jgi:O-antigen/teichoic acid export membrane protein